MLNVCSDVCRLLPVRQTLTTALELLELIHQQNTHTCVRMVISNASAEGSVMRSCVMSQLNTISNTSSFSWFQVTLLQVCVCVVC